jgi:hypothetical protein
LRVACLKSTLGVPERSGAQSHDVMVSLQRKLLPLVQPALDAVTYFRLSAKRMLLLSLAAGAHGDLSEHEEPLPVAGVNGVTEEEVAEVVAQREEETYAAVLEYLMMKVEDNSAIHKVWTC